MRCAYVPYASSALRLRSSRGVTGGRRADRRSASAVRLSHVRLDGRGLAARADALARAEHVPAGASVQWADAVARSAGAGLSRGSGTCAALMYPTRPVRSGCVPRVASPAVVGRISAAHPPSACLMYDSMGAASRHEPMLPRGVPGPGFESPIPPLTTSSAWDCARRSPSGASTDRSACAGWRHRASRPAPATATSRLRRGSAAAALHCARR